MSNIELKLEELGIELPDAAAPAANYLPYLVEDNLVYISGQLPMLNGEILLKGKLGDNVSI